MISFRSSSANSPGTLALAGVIFTVIGVVFSLVASLAISSDLARIQSLQPIGAILLEDAPNGREVMIEGRISEQATPSFRSFATYVREEYRGDDSDGDTLWVEDDSDTPPLLLDLPDGAVRLRNQDYRLAGELTIWQESTLMRWDSSTGEGTKRYSGLEPGASVLVIGQAAGNGDGAAIDAEVLAGGTRASYIAEQRLLKIIFGGLGGFFLVLGLLMIGITVLRLLRRAGANRARYE